MEKGVDLEVLQELGLSQSINGHNKNNHFMIDISVSVAKRDVGAGGKRNLW